MTRQRVAESSGWLAQPDATADVARLDAEAPALRRFGYFP
jgi:hypothetical protein